METFLPAPEVEPDPAERWILAHLPHYLGALVCVVVVAGMGYLFLWAATISAPGFGVSAVVALVAFAGPLTAGAFYAIKRGNRT